MQISLRISILSTSKIQVGKTTQDLQALSFRIPQYRIGFQEMLKTLDIIRGKLKLYKYEVIQGYLNNITDSLK